ncbi:MAG TPA: HEAT repeat domain-containing protein, partial [Kofleriaceae bacterium]|nr:HEAT repeat domain-containing protein [Kofleriaceae bacterium]
AALVRAARDPDPGVREVAAGALGERGQAGDEALGRQLAGDRWPRVRRAAAIALGTGCKRAQPAGGLRRAVLGDSDVQVRRAALSSLASCNADGAVRFFLTVAADRRAPVDVRTLALRLIGGSGDRSAARPLAELVTAELERAFSDERAIAPAAAGAYALGELGDPSGIPVVVRAAEAVAFPEIQAAAAAALGRLCPPSAMRLLRQLAASGQHQVSAPARAALRRCRAR